MRISEFSLNNTIRYFDIYLMLTGKEQLNKLVLALRTEQEASFFLLSYIGFQEDITAVDIYTSNNRMVFRYKTELGGI